MVQNALRLVLLVVVLFLHQSFAVVESGNIDMANSSIKNINPSYYGTRFSDVGGYPFKTDLIGSGATVDCPVPNTFNAQCFEYGVPDGLPVIPASFQDVSSGNDVADFIALGGNITGICGQIIIVSFDVHDQGAGTNACPGNPTTVQRSIEVYDDLDNDGPENSELITNCLQTFTIVDNTIPVVTCQDITIQLDNNGMASIVATDVLNTATDNCAGTLAFSLNTTDFLCNDVVASPINVILTATDVCGNMGTCEAQVTVEDVTPPILTCPLMEGEMCNITEEPPYADFDAFIAAGGIFTDACNPDPSTFMHISTVSDGLTCPETFTRTYQIADIGGNTARCTQTIVINDVTPPVVNACPADVNLECGAELPAPPADIVEFLNIWGDVSDNCTIATLIQMTVSDDVDPSTFSFCLADGPFVVTRSYTFTDMCGNMNATCSHTFTYAPDTEDPVVTCVNYNTDTDATDGDNDGDFCNTFVTIDPPMVMDCTPVTITHNYPMGASASDPSGVYSLGTTMVTWTVTDQCGMVSTCDFEVNVVDDDEPTMVCTPPMNVVLGGTGSATLDADDFIISATDNCGTVVDAFVQFMTPTCDCPIPSFDNHTYIGEYNGHYYYASDFQTRGEAAYNHALATGGYPVVINDAAENAWLHTFAMAEGDQFIIGYTDREVEGSFEWVGDASGYTNWNPPSEPDNTPVGADGEGADYAVILPGDGMWEDRPVSGPGELSRYIIEVENICGPSAEITFCCQNAQENPVMVVVTTFDDAGNVATCMVEVNVLDETDPTITCPSDIIIDCEYEFDPNDLSEFGTIVIDPELPQDIIYDGNILGQDGFATDNCLSEGLTVADELFGLDDLVCNQGILTRRFTVTDASGNTSTCDQTILVDNFNPFDETDITWPADITLEECTTVPAVADSGEPQYVDGRCEDIFEGFVDDLLPNPHGDNVCDIVERTWQIIDWCQYDPNSGSDVGRFTYVQYITITNTTAPVFADGTTDMVTVCADNASCTADLNISASATDDCTVVADLVWSYEIDINGAGSTILSGNGSTITGNYPIGEHIVTWTVTDHCNNSSEASFLLDIRDCKAPTLVCYQGLAIDLQNMNGNVMVQVFASDFVNHVEDNCALAADLTISFSVDPSDDSVIFTCSDLDEQEVTIWATDPHNNVSRCVTFIDVQDSQNDCENAPEMGMIAGKVKTQKGHLFDEVEVVVDSPINFDTYMTDTLGSYAFENLPMHQDYSLSASHDFGHLDGVTTLDILLIQKHVLGIQSLDSPEKIIAADINNNMGVSSSDVSELRKLVLGIQSSFAYNESWKFIPSNQRFDDLQNPWNYVESIVYNDLSTDQMHSDFKGIKVGDVNESYSQIVDSNNSITSRDKAPIKSLVIEDKELVKGQAIVVPFKLEEAMSLAGLQMSLEFDTKTLKYKGIQQKKLSIQPSDINQKDNIINVSWIDPMHTNLKENEELFALVFEAKEDGFLMENIFLANAETHLKPEIYDENEKVNTLELDLRSITDDQFIVFQNKPNPFKDYTEISFQLPREDFVTIVIYSGNGQLVYSNKDSYEKGKHTLEIGKSEHGLSSGMYFYKIKTNEFSATKQMLLVD